MVNINNQSVAYQSLNSSRQLKDCTLGAIDIGTNSIHMVVVEINAQIPSFTIIAKEKDTVRLGDRNLENGNLTVEAMERSLSALKRCKDLADSLKVDQIIAVATSATREAPNGIEFLSRIESELGIKVDLISGQEEARRIYLGVLSGMDFEGRIHSVIDIGGGSTEMVLADPQETRHLSSTKVGAVRLSQDFITTDPVSEKEFIRLQAYIRGMLERPVDEFKNALPEKEKPLLVGTSGTIETIAVIHAMDTQGSEPNPLNGYEISRKDIEAILKKLLKMDYDERASLSGMSDRRAEIIVPGITILLEAMTMLEIDSITICERALREGIIVDWMLQNGYIENRLVFQTNVRARSVMKIAHKYQVDLPHAQRIAQFALKIFDQTQGELHDWGEKEREYLWAAAILHNCGLYISHGAHHKHSYYLIRHAELLGFTEIEVELIAQIARYHRKSKPKRKHESYYCLAHDNRKIIKQMSAMLRLAIALDRRQIGAIKDLECKYDSEYKKLHLQLIPTVKNDDCALELWNLDYKKPIFENEFEVKVLATLTN
ncbi:Ppx/GppA family phosphatase [Cyanobacterium stanieri LEGE 03274]|uniref:Ppx/GppA family phosphatase n=1 Tax=Cyanobacterium stanieri LEGE 03274 TaxID=1828756 RepID=A0ABR9V2A2_9CHRO|nr:Ppx/GppA phosphatase family protein [Cyanobacterium stanieri]MBE9222025.1 Ppx/GppA family phosphatase [Cyanobacterium stanieri LEGE 03274]